MLDLESIFGPDAPGPATMPPAVGESAEHYPTAAVALADDDALAESRFADWIRRPDATGRWGWERRGLPDRQLWWAHSTFEGLPEPPPPCSKCGSLVPWETLAGTCRCVQCDPPTTSIEALQQAERIRGRNEIPTPAGAAELLGDLKLLTARG